MSHIQPSIWYSTPQVCKKDNHAYCKYRRAAIAPNTSAMEPLAEGSDVPLPVELGDEAAPVGVPWEPVPVVLPAWNVGVFVFFMDFEELVKEAELMVVFLCIVLAVPMLAAVPVIVIVAFIELVMPMLKRLVSIRRATQVSVYPTLPCSSLKTERPRSRTQGPPLGQ